MKKNLLKASSQTAGIFVFSLVVFITSIVEARVPQSVLAQKRAVVTIYVNNKEGARLATGSGFLVAPNGIIATNYHIVSTWLKSPNNTMFFRMGSGVYYPAEALIAFDEDNDVALLRIKGKELPSIRLAMSYKIKEGESVAVMGSPFGLETTVSEGIISGVLDNKGLIQVTAPVSPGSSGSPVFNSKGEVIGVASFLFQGSQKINVAIPIKTVANLLNESSKPRKKTESAQSPESAGSTPEPGSNGEAAVNEARNDPDSASAYFSLGRNYGKSGMYKEAIEALRQAVRLKPDYADAFFSLGIYYRKAGMNNKAIEAMKQGIRLKPSFAAEAYCDIGINYGELGMYKEAIAADRQALELKPDMAEAYCDLGSNYGGVGMYKEAIEAYKQAIRRNPDLAEAHYGLGYVYVKPAGMYKEATEAFKQAIRIKPDYVEAHFSLGVVSLILNDKGAALEEYKILKNLNSEQADRLFGLIYK